jgi:hypothetical protein
MGMHSYQLRSSLVKHQMPYLLSLHFFDDKSVTFSMEGEVTLEVLGSSSNSDCTCAISKVTKSAGGSGKPVFRMAPELLSHF